MAIGSGYEQRFKALQREADTTDKSTQLIISAIRLQTEVLADKLDEINSAVETVSTNIMIWAPDD